MSGFIKQKFIALVRVLLYVDESLATNCVSMNSQPYMIRPTLADLNHVNSITMHLLLM